MYKVSLLMGVMFALLSGCVVPPAPHVSPLSSLMSAIQQSVSLCPVLYKANLPTRDFLEFASHWHYSRVYRIN